MKKTYSEKYKSPQWQKKRLEIMSRDGFCCTNCGCQDSTLAVHHSYYVSGRDPWQYPDWSLRTLCETCHEEIHCSVDDGNGFQDWEQTIERIVGDRNHGDGRLWDFGVEVEKSLKTFPGSKEWRLEKLTNVLRRATSEFKNKAFE